MKKELVKFGFVVFAAVAMAACGGATEETTETEPETPATTTEEPATVEEPVTTPAEGDSACDAACEDGAACDGTEKAAH